MKLRSLLSAHHILPLVVLAVLVRPATGFDEFLEGTSMGPSGNKIDVKELQPSEFQEVLDTAASIYGQGFADAIASEVQAGTLTIGQLPGAVPSSVVSTHDSDTIGVNGRNSMEANAVAVKHEYEHIQNARAAGADHDPTVSLSSADPCAAAMKHYGMCSSSAADMCELAAGAEASGNTALQASLCKSFEHSANAGSGALADATLFYGCDFPSSGSTSASCPSCP